ncbi:hypothetical protein L1887_21126 [Cichorium endivia]|nr:hypothetical protein L1887_21126 [Cichorium endivia]
MATGVEAATRDEEEEDGDGQDSYDYLGETDKRSNGITGDRDPLTSKTPEEIKKNIHEPRWSKQQLFDHETGYEQHTLVENPAHHFSQLAIEVVGIHGVGTSYIF